MTERKRKKSTRRKSSRRRVELKRLRKFQRCKRRPYEAVSGDDCCTELQARIDALQVQFDQLEQALLDVGDVINEIQEVVEAGGSDGGNDGDIG